MEAEKLEPVRVEELDGILGQKFPVLDDGFVRPVDYMGGDSSIVQAARVSYGRGTKTIRDDRNLIRYLMRHRHTTPLEMCEIKLHVRVPMDCQDLAREVYDERLEFGVAREQASAIGTYTEAYWKIDLHNLFHFLRLRMDSHAQAEIGAYANVIGNEIVAKWVPFAWEAFEDYRLEAMHLTRMEVCIFGVMNVTDNKNAVIGLSDSFGWMEKQENGSIKVNRERQECEAKLNKLGLKAPWKE